MKKIAIISETPENFKNFESSYEADLLFEKLKNQIFLFANNTKNPWILSSMNLGLSTLAAEIALLVKEKTNLKLECVIPFEEQAKYFTEPERDRYFSIIERCNKETLLATQKTANSNIAAASYMVEQADIILVGFIKNKEIKDIIENSNKHLVNLYIGA